MKACNKCGETKKLSEFHKYACGLLGVRAVCKVCRNEGQRNYASGHKEEAKAYRKIYYVENKDAIDAKNKEWYKNNRDKADEYAAEYRADNREKQNKQKRVWSSNNKERVRSSKRKWKMNNKDKVSAYLHKRRARKAGNGGSYTAKEWKKLCKKYKNRCLCCGEKKKLTPDHVIPIIKGGTSDIENIQPLCLSCNCRKGVSETDYRSLSDPLQI